MSITDELRKWAEDNTLQDMVLTTYPPQHAVHGVLETLLRIADRIDAEHEKAIASVMNDALYYANDKNMAELGWIRLPKDADGEYIHIGDEMEGVDKYDSLKKAKGEVIAVSFESDGIVDVAIQAWNSDGKSWHRAYLDSGASVYRHYHAPTVEDALWEMLYKAHIYDEREMELLPDLVAEYAAKLCLADDGKGQ